MKRILFSVMVLILTFGVSVCAEFKDMPDNWSAPALKSAVDNGLMNGYNGYINPDNSLTRAEMAAVITRAFQVEKSGDISRFTDVTESDWYYGVMSKAVGMGAFNGSGNKLNPTVPITREEAFTVLARVFCLEAENTSVLDKFSDKSEVSVWAVETVSALVENGYVNGSNGRINPKSKITRAEFAQLMYNAVTLYIDDDLSQEVSGNIIIKKSVIIKNTVVNGDVIITDGVDVTFENVTVKGRLLSYSDKTDTLDGNFNAVIILADNAEMIATQNSKIGFLKLVGKNSRLILNGEEMRETPEIKDDKGNWSEWYE